MSMDKAIVLPEPDMCTEMIIEMSTTGASLNKACERFGSKIGVNKDTIRWRFIQALKRQDLFYKDVCQQCYDRYYSIVNNIKTREQVIREINKSGCTFEVYTNETKLNRRGKPVIEDRKGLYEFVSARLGKMTVQDAAKEYATLNNLPSARTAVNSYYNYRRELLVASIAHLDENPIIVENPITPEIDSTPIIETPDALDITVDEIDTIIAKEPECTGDDFMKMFTTMINNSEEAGIDLKQVLGGLAPLFSFAAESAELRSKAKTINRVHDRNVSLEKTLVERDSEIAQLKAQMMEMTEDVRTVNRILTEFMSLESLKKYAMLEKFTQDFKYVIDKMGWVQRVQIKA
jgi:flagellar biosynthesis/type III secretory pathway chaperone